tara:strand:- start:40798 stop:41595 length:798 start_codon:yes stop_codon:yes gene_type:complete
MKKLNLLYIFCCFAFIAQAQVVQNESFDAATLPTGWKVTNSTDCSWNFGYADNLPFIDPETPVKLASGSVIFNDNKCGGFKNNVLELEGPEVNLSAAGVLKADIEITYNHQTFVGSGNFMVDVWDGNDWQNVLTVTEDSPAKGSSEIATTSVLDVSEYINSAFKVRFVYDDQNTRTWGVAIDSYKLLNTADGFLYYPNPVSDILNLHAAEKISIINVYNAIGQHILSEKPSTLSTKLDMGNLASGVYMVQVKAGKLNENIKIFKN